MLFEGYCLPVLHRQAVLHGLIRAIVSERTKPGLQALRVDLLLVRHSDHAEIRPLVRQNPCEVLHDGDASQQQNLKCPVRLPNNNIF